VVFFSLAPQPPWALAFDFQFHDHFTDGRTPWTSDQIVARPLPKHRTTQTQNKTHTHKNIHAFCGIRTYDPGFRMSEVTTCLRPLGYSDQLDFVIQIHNNADQQYCDFQGIVSCLRLYVFSIQFHTSTLVNA
jgi:hypothetical protein